jgi:MucB/RseB N-terminal domain
MRMLARLLLLVLVSPPLLARAQDTPSVPSADEIVARMGARDAQRQLATEGYAGMRKYILENEGLHKHAEMIVRVNGDPDGTKHFEIVSEEGWKAAHKHVLRKMLDSEAETSRPEARAKARLNAENYDFQLVGVEGVGDRPAYVLELSPKRKEKYLFRGRIWVDAEDYALVRAEGKPAENPSFWTKSTHFVQNYGKSGPAWFPVSTQSATEARIFGTTYVNIEYFDYMPRASFSDVSFLTAGELFAASEASHGGR